MYVTPVFKFNAYFCKVSLQIAKGINGMNRVFCILLLGFFCHWGFAQKITKEEIEEYTDIGEMSWSNRAKELKQEYPLDENGELTLCTVKPYEGQSKAELYKKILDWILSDFQQPQSSLQLSDEKAGKIYVRCHLPEIARRRMGDNLYRVSIRPLLKFEFKEGKVRITFILQCYDVLKRNDDSGYVMMFGNGFGVTGSGVTTDNQIWNLAYCYPFAEKEERKYPKVTSARAYVNTVSCYLILLDRIEQVLSKKAEDEDDDW